MSQAERFSNAQRTGVALQILDMIEVTDGLEWSLPGLEKSFSLGISRLDTTTAIECNRREINMALASIGGLRTKIAELGYGDARFTFWHGRDPHAPEKLKWDMEHQLGTQLMKQVVSTPLDSLHAIRRRYEQNDW